MFFLTFEHDLYCNWGSLMSIPEGRDQLSVIVDSNSWVRKPMFFLPQEWLIFGLPDLDYLRSHQVPTIIGHYKWVLKSMFFWSRCKQTNKQTNEFFSYDPPYSRGNNGKSSHHRHVHSLIRMETAVMFKNTLWFFLFEWKTEMSHQHVHDEPVTKDHLDHRFLMELSKMLKTNNEGVFLFFIRKNESCYTIFTDGCWKLITWTTEGTRKRRNFSRKKNKFFF